MDRCVAVLMALATWLALTVPLHARSLKQAIPSLFGGSLATSIDFSDLQDAQRPRVADRFRSLSADLATARSQAPIPSASGAFRFSWNPGLDTFVRFHQSLGVPFAERAQTLGKGSFSFGLSYSRVDFDTVEGDRLGSLSSRQPALSDEFLEQLPGMDVPRFDDDVLETQLSLDFAFDLFFVSAAYGLTDTIDIGLALSINRVRMRAQALAAILDSDGEGDAFFAANQPGAITDGVGPICGVPFKCAFDSFDETRAGTGDLFLRAKWHFASMKFADLAAGGVLTLPTGNADDFLGFHDPTFTPWLIASKNLGRFAPHFNVGYAIRSGEDVSQAQWVAGTDFRVTNWLTLAGDFLGYHDDKRDGINDNVIQSAVGFKINPFDQAVITAAFQFPVNRDGLRADVIYTGAIEYTF